MQLDLDKLKALCDETRLEIIMVLGKKEMNVNEIADKCSVSRPTISHHLQILKRNRIVEARKEGKEMYYNINPSSLIMIAENLLNFVSQIY